VGFTLVSFHAHPDDEALLTGGTLARAAAEGHRVVVVVATAGEAGLTAGPTAGPTENLGSRRLAELHASARALGVARVECLGYADSGHGADARASGAFADADVEEAAGRLAALLTEERADALTTYDARGGYGHVDHVQVHQVGRRAAELAGTPVVLEATMDRAVLLRAVSLLARIPRLGRHFDAEPLRSAYTERARLTHRVDVRRYADRKRTALAAHASQTSGGPGPRTVGVLLRLPRPLFRRLAGREWFVESGRCPAQPLLDDVFASLRRP
jgi:LmbE family N-acetylglucosaminyl deacetylase